MCISYVLYLNNRQIMENAIFSLLIKKNKVSPMDMKIDPDLLDARSVWPMNNHHSNYYGKNWIILSIQIIKKTLITGSTVRTVHGVALDSCSPLKKSRNRRLKIDKPQKKKPISNTASFWRELCWPISTVNRFIMPVYGLESILAAKTLKSPSPTHTRTVTLYI